MGKGGMDFKGAIRVVFATNTAITNAGYIINISIKVTSNNVITIPQLNINCILLPYTV